MSTRCRLWIIESTVALVRGRRIIPASLLTPTESGTPDQWGTPDDLVEVSIDMGIVM